MTDTKINNFLVKTSSKIKAANRKREFKIINQLTLFKLTE